MPAEPHRTPENRIASVVPPLQRLDAVRVAVSTSCDAAGAVAEIVATLGDSSDLGFLLLFVSSQFDAEDVATALFRAFPDLPHAGCSTAGEITPRGLIDGGLVAIGFRKSEFRIACEPMRDLGHFGLEEGGELVADLRRRLFEPPSTETPDLFALTLLDGLCQREEVVLSALQRALGDIPLVGGSSGDDLSFQSTFVVSDGEVLRDAGLLLLVASTRPFRVFKSDHFEPTDRKLVVTDCDPDKRVVSELDAEPAWEAFAAATGLDHEQPSGDQFAAHPLLVRVGGEYYCRSIQKMNMDGSLSFYCAIDTGVVLTVAETRDMVEALTETLSGLEADLGGIDFVLGFDCIHRRLEAERRQITARICEIFRRYKVIGFNTYGEQYDAMHLNHTFTGVAFGHRPDAS